RADSRAPTAASRAASMRPPFVTAEVLWRLVLEHLGSSASMRPPFVTAEVRRRQVVVGSETPASMRPPFVTAEVRRSKASPFSTSSASMRPPFVTAEVQRVWQLGERYVVSFNEAAVRDGGSHEGDAARPRQAPRFNEAAVR